MSTWTPVDPTWIGPSVFAFRDLFWLSAAAADVEETAWTWGLAATTAWLRGGRDAPITCRAGLPTRGAAVVELWSAQGVIQRSDPTTAAGPLPPLEALSAEHGLQYLEPRMVHADVARAAVAVCGWVTGIRSDCPITLPTRLPNGALATVDDIVTQAVRATPRMTPEARARLRVTADRAVARSARLAELIAGTRA